MRAVFVAFWLEKHIFFEIFPGFCLRIWGTFCMVTLYKWPVKAFPLWKHYLWVAFSKMLKLYLGKAKLNPFHTWPWTILSRASVFNSAQPSQSLQHFGIAGHWTRVLDAEMLDWTVQNTQKSAHQNCTNFRLWTSWSFLCWESALETSSTSVQNTSPASMVSKMPVFILFSFLHFLKEKLPLAYRCDILSNLTH